MSDNAFDLELLGQKLKYPTTWQSAVGISLVLAITSITILGLANILTPERLKAVTAAYSVFRNGNEQTKALPASRVEFWTPSVRTREYFTKKKLETGNDIPSDYQWQVSDDMESKINDFAKKILDDSRTGGYRRSEVIGEGASRHQKWGLWWVIGVNGEMTEDYRNWLIDTYRKHWKLPINETIYLEVVSSPAR